MLSREQRPRDRFQNASELLSLGDEEDCGLWKEIIHFKVYSNKLDILLCLNAVLYSGASLVTQSIKNLSAMQETQVQSLGQEDPLEKEMATHSSILSWRIPWAEEPGGL